MKWENDVASGEERARWRQSLIFLRYPFLPFGHAVRPHSFVPYPCMYPTWLTLWLLAQPGTWRVLANERIMKRAVARSSPAKKAGRWITAAELTLGWKKWYEKEPARLP